MVFCTLSSKKYKKKRTNYFLFHTDLRNMYKLLKPFPNGLTVMVEEVQNHIARIGLEAVNGLKGDNVIYANIYSCFIQIKTNIFIWALFFVRLKN